MGTQLSYKHLLSLPASKYPRGYQQTDDSNDIVSCIKCDAALMTAIYAKSRSVTQFISVRNEICTVSDALQAEAVHGMILPF